MGVSSRESWAYRLTDGTSRYECFFYKIMIFLFETKINLCNFFCSYWQSCGTQGKHWIRLELQQDVLIHSLRIQVDPADSTYMPSVIVVR